MESERHKVPVLILVGPDGVGKSTVATALCATGLIIRHEHFRPYPIRHDMDGAPQPHALAPRGLLTSTLKCLYLWVEQLIARWRGRGTTGITLIERGWLDQIIDPARYRLHARTTALSTLLARLLPRPDLVAVLYADPAVVVNRKQELPESEIARQFDAWRLLLKRLKFESLIVDATRDPHEVSAILLRQLGAVNEAV